MTFGAIVQKNGFYALRILGSCGQFTAEELLNLAKLANLAKAVLQLPAEAQLNWKASVKLSWKKQLRQLRQQDLD